MGTAIKIDGQWIPIMQYAEWLKDAKRQGQRQEAAFGAEQNGKV